jgi:NAD(P)-dependent dehydrogenase (short-subunit alcohol dehydrogenase family)
MGEDAQAALYASEAARLPVGHSGDVEQIAQSYLYLTGQTYVTGQVLHVDGGALLDAA